MSIVLYETAKNKPEHRQKVLVWSSYFSMWIFARYSKTNDTFSTDISGKSKVKSYVFKYWKPQPPDPPTE